MRARTGLWEPRGGNDPGPPGPRYPPALAGRRRASTGSISLYFCHPRAVNGYEMSSLAAPVCPRPHFLPPPARLRHHGSPGTRNTPAWRGCQPRQADSVAAPSPRGDRSAPIFKSSQAAAYGSRHAIHEDGTREDGEFYGPRPLPEAPTGHPPGSAAKIEVMRERAEQFEQLHHPQDAGVEGLTIEALAALVMQPPPKRTDEEKAARRAKES